MNQIASRKRRAKKTRAKVLNSNRLRLLVKRTSAHIYAQIIQTGLKGDEVLVSASTVEKDLKTKLKGTKAEKAFQVGVELAKKAKEKKIVQVGFDRAGFKYHGRVAQVAQGAREGGLDF